MFLNYRCCYSLPIVVQYADEFLTPLCQLGFAQVQLALEFTQEFVADPPLVSELDGGR